MNCVRFFIPALITASSLMLSCTFSYGAGEESSGVYPEMVMVGARADRYEDSSLSITFSAATLEMYDSDRVWVAEDISFIQYAPDGSGSVESDGYAGLMLVDDVSEVYSLGEIVSIRLLSENLYLTAPDLRWSKGANRLSGPRGGEVEIRRTDGSVIRGKGFFADTLNRSYMFEEGVSGRMVTESSDNQEEAPSESPDPLESGDIDQP